MSVDIDRGFVIKADAVNEPVEDLDLVEDIEEEIKQHRNTLQTEVKRHENSMEENLEESGLGELRERIEELNSKKSKLSNQKTEIKELLYSGIYYTMSRKRTSVDDKLTVRDKTIFYFNTSNEVSLRKVLDTYKFEISSYAQDTERNDLLEGIRLVQDSNLPNFKVKLEKDISDKKTDFDKLEYTLGGRHKPKVIDTESEMTREYKINLFNMYKRRRNNKFDLKNFSMFMLLKDEIEDLVEELHNEVDREIEEREKLQENLKNNFKTQFMMGGFE